MTATPDTSVVVAGLSAWHPDHDIARTVLERRPPVCGHVLVESYSVLTRLPQPRRLAPSIVTEALLATFRDDPITLGAAALRRLVGRLTTIGVAGGSVYDALVAETAREHGLELATLDRRATTTYDAVGVRVEFLR